MSISQPIRRPVKPSEEGYLLISVMFLMAVLVLWLSVAVPRMSKSIQRDRDLETKQRGKQYIRAVQLYYRKFGAYPPSQDALVKTNDIRFLRKKYVDPTTGKDDWKPILFGQNKVPTAMGFFGQPLATGGAIAGIGPSGGNINGNGLNGAGGVPGFGSAGSGIGNSSTNSIFGNSDTSNTTGGTTGSTDSSGNASGSGSNSTGGSNSSSTGTNSSTGLTGQSFGGAGIIGFSPASSKQSLLIYKKKDHYNQWEFTYDPIMDMKMMSGGNTGMIGQPIGNGATPGFSGIPGITAPGSSPSTTPNSGSGSSGSGNSDNGPGSSSPPETQAPQPQ